MTRRLAPAVVVVAALAACAGRPSGAASQETAVDSTDASPVSSAAPARCDSATPIVLDSEHGPEVVGVATDATLYGLVFLRRALPIQVGDDVKIVWRMTGEGDLTVQLIDPTGRERPLLFGPERHGDSTYDRPGDEWGTGFLFDQEGCWQIRLEREVGSGDVWVNVVARFPSTDADGSAPESSTDEVQRFPDVIDVDVSGDDGVYDFAVTISSPYDTPERYADGWRVMGVDGTVYAEHQLLHDHAGEQPFTRTQTGVEIPEGIDEVVVEARDSVYGYGGETVTVTLPDR